jgi:DNA-binding GntR family transcriptional regulator
MLDQARLVVDQFENNQAGRAYDRLRSEVLSCRVSPGNRINVSSYSQNLEVSPGAVREALSRLAAEGLVTAEQNRGFRAANLVIEDFAKLTEARTMIDTLCLRSSLEHGDVDWEANLLAACHRLDRRLLGLDGSIEAEDLFADAHAGFHKALVSGCRNEWLLWMHDLLYAQSSRYRKLCMPTAAEKPRIHDFQGRFITHVLARETDTAVYLLEEYYSAARKIVTESLQSGTATLER